MTDMSTPRERIENFMAGVATAIPEGMGEMASLRANVRGEVYEMHYEDLRAVLSANKSYESLMRDAAREAVADYKKELAESLEALKRGETEDGIDMLDNVIDGLKEGSL